MEIIGERLIKITVLSILLIIALVIEVKARRVEIYDIDSASYKTGDIDEHGHGELFDIDTGSFETIDIEPEYHHRKSKTKYPGRPVQATPFKTGKAYTNHGETYYYKELPGTYLNPPGIYDPTKGQLYYNNKKYIFYKQNTIKEYEFEDPRKWLKTK
jgi:hypothetical protein